MAFTAREIAEFAEFLRNCTDAQIEHIRMDGSVDEERALAAIEARHRQAATGRRSK